MKKVPARVRPRPPADGFALIELVIATTIGAMLLVALAEVVQLIGQGDEALHEDADRRLEECMARLTDEVRRAWIVQEPESDALLLTDAHGNETRYAFERGAQTLRVTRNSGPAGTLLTGVETFSIDAQVSTRYRDDRPLDSYGTWWELSADGVALEALPVEAGLRVALGFTLTTHAPDWVSTLDEVSEQALGATLEQILIPLSYAPPVPEPITTAHHGPATDDKIKVCHSPPGIPTNAQDLTVPRASLSAHLAHGDVEGGCPTAPTNSPDVTGGVLFIDLHEAIAPGDARPFGPRLGSISLPVNALPTASWSWRTKGEGDALTFGTGESGNEVALCHIPPGNPADAHTLLVSSNAVAMHLEHGDVVGSCDDASDSPSTRVLAYAPPTTRMALDLTPFDALIRPGHAYALVFRLSGTGAILMAGHPVGSEKHTGIAAAHRPGGAFSPLDYAVPFSLDGMRTYSQTTAHPVIHGLTMMLRMLDGETHSGTASVLSQSAVPDPWLGCVPGELPGLELAGP